MPCPFTRLQNLKMHIFVMLAWIAGIHQARKDAYGDIRVNLDSSIPYWNDAIFTFLYD